MKKICRFCMLHFSDQCLQVFKHHSSRALWAAVLLSSLPGARSKNLSVEIFVVIYRLLARIQSKLLCLWVFLTNSFSFCCSGQQSSSLAHSWMLSRKWLTLQLEHEVRWDVYLLCLSLALSAVSPHKQSVSPVMIMRKAGSRTSQERLFKH